MDEEVRKTFYNIKELTTIYNIVIFLESFFLIMILWNIITLLQYFRWISFFIGSVKRSFEITVYFLAIYFIIIAGMTITTMTLYGSHDPKYTYFGSTILYLFVYSVFAG